MDPDQIEALTAKLNGLTELLSSQMQPNTMQGGPYGPQWQVVPTPWGPQWTPVGPIDQAQNDLAAFQSQQIAANSALSQYAANGGGRRDPRQLLLAALAGLGGGALSKSLFPSSDTPDWPGNALVAIGTDPVNQIPAPVVSAAAGATATVVLATLPGTQIHTRHVHTWTLTHAGAGLAIGQQFAVVLPTAMQRSFAGKAPPAISIRTKTLQANNDQLHIIASLTGDVITGYVVFADVIPVAGVATFEVQIKDPAED